MSDRPRGRWTRWSSGRCCPAARRSRSVCRHHRLAPTESRGSPSASLSCCLHGVKRVVEWELANEERAALTDAARVESGDTLAFGGKTLHRGPVAFARELVRRDVDGLGHVGLAKSIEVDLLCATGQLDRVDFGYVGFEALGLAPNFRRRAEAGNLEVREGSCYTVATALRAVSLLPGVDRETVRERTGWPVTFADPERVEPPTDAELTALERVDPTRVRRSGFDTDRLSRA